MSQVPVIAIDGPSGSGKGTIARQVARHFGWHLLDSGALYRLVALAGMRAGLASGDVAGHARLAADLDVQFGMDAKGDERVVLGGRGRHAANCAPRQPARPHPGSPPGSQCDRPCWAASARLRRPPGLVADGRDMGSIVFRDAGLKIFLTASPEERARRRYKQLKEKGLGGSLAALSAEIAERDRRDTTRAVAPLVAVPEAVVVDSTALTIEEVVGRVIELARERFPEAARGR